MFTKKPPRIRLIETFHTAPWLMLCVMIAVVVSADQLTKKMVSSWHHAGMLPMKVTPFFNLVYVQNKGISFGLLPATGPWGVWLLLLGALAIVSLLLVWYAHATVRMRLVLSLLIGGALGNMIDRFFYGGVIDFIDVYYQTWHFPAFNVADTMISLGTLLILWDAPRGESKGT